MTDTTDLGWWAIAGNELLDALHRVHHGDDPVIVYAELYANASVTRPDHHGTDPDSTPPPT